MGQQLPTGGSQPSKKDPVGAALQSLIVSQRQGNASKTSLSASAMPTKRAAPAQRQRIF